MSGSSGSEKSMRTYVAMAEIQAEMQDKSENLPEMRFKRRTRVNQ